MVFVCKKKKNQYLVKHASRIESLPPLARALEDSTDALYHKKTQISHFRYRRMRGRPTRLLWPEQGLREYDWFIQMRPLRQRLHAQWWPHRMYRLVQLLYAGAGRLAQSFHQPTQLFPSLRHWVSAILALSGATDHGKPWPRAVYFGPIEQWKT